MLYSSVVGDVCGGRLQRQSVVEDVQEEVCCTLRWLAMFVADAFSASLWWKMYKKKCVVLFGGWRCLWRTPSAPVCGGRCTRRSVLYSSVVGDVCGGRLQRQSVVEDVQEEVCCTPRWLAMFVADAFSASLWWKMYKKKCVVLFGGWRCLWRTPSAPVCGGRCTRRSVLYSSVVGDVCGGRLQRQSVVEDVQEEVCCTPRWLAIFVADAFSASLWWKMYNNVSRCYVLFNTDV